MSSNDFTDMDALYGAFCDTATALSGRYVALANQAQTVQEEEQWMDKVMRLRDERRRVSPTDRATLTEHMERWAKDLRELEGR